MYNALKSQQKELRKQNKFKELLDQEYSKRISFWLFFINFDDLKLKVYDMTP